MVREITKDTFYDDIKAGKVLVDFYSKTCGPCKMLGFILEDLAKDNDDVDILKVDFEENGDLVKEYGVEGYPTLIMFNDGEEVSRHSGLQQKPKIQAMIDQA